MLDNELQILLGYPNNFDVVRREIGVSESPTILFFLASLTNSEPLNDLIEGILEIKPGDFSKQIVNGSLQQGKTTQEAFIAVSSGMLVILRPDTFYIAEIRHYPGRSIDEPATEKSIRGSKDGFTENIIQNVGLIRRRIRNPNLRLEKMQAGDASKTDLVLCYMEDRVRKSMVDATKAGIESLVVDDLVMTDRALEESLFSQGISYFPLVRYTERPDIVAIQILHGNLAILVDTSASVILTPTTIFEHMKHVEEYRQTPFIGTITRLIRYLAIILSVFLVPLWFLIVAKTDFEYAFFVRPTSELAISLFWQIIIVEIMFEIMRIATIHTPSQLSSAIGLIAAILLGDMAISLGVFIPEILLYCSISAIGGFATPSYELSLANKITKLILLVLIALWGSIGFMIGFFGLAYYLVSIRVFGHPYLYPLLPFDGKAMIELFYREPKQSNKK